MNSFNVYGQTEQVVGGNTPIWLGTVKPIPIGFVNEALTPNQALKAGQIVYKTPDGTPAVASSLFEEVLETAFGYVYNDVVTNEQVVMSNTYAVVMHHPEGLLIERVYPEITEEQIATLQAKIPGVLLVRG